MNPHQRPFAFKFLGCHMPSAINYRAPAKN
jgi:hypothetical protein